MLSRAALAYLPSMVFKSEREGQASGTGFGPTGSGTAFSSQTSDAGSCCILRPRLGAARQDLQQPERGAGQAGCSKGGGLSAASFLPASTSSACTLTRLQLSQRHARALRWAARGQSLAPHQGPPAPGSLPAGRKGAGAAAVWAPVPLVQMPCLHGHGQAEERGKASCPDGAGQELPCFPILPDSVTLAWLITIQL